jgi:8-amino-7-oxononanoate synthase
MSKSDNRKLRVYQIESPIGPRVVINHREVDYFSGTGYLGLQSRPEVIEAGIETLHRYGVSTATSRGGFGEHPVYSWLEREACTYFAAENALFFPSGYLGMAVLLQTELRPNDHLFIDSGTHYSAWDACLAANRVITPFHHLDPESLAEVLQSELQPGEHPLVITDGVFPISGEIAPLNIYLQKLEPYNGRVFVDDAHSLGVLGENGRGTAEYFHLFTENIKTCGTLAKALGGYGGIITGRSEWIQRAEQNSGICIGASPPPLVTAAASAQALAIARTEPELRHRLWENVKLARKGLRTLGWELEDSPVPIICLPALTGMNLACLHNRLFDRGIAVAYIQSYTSTPPGGALRLAISAKHSAEQIRHLVDTISELI